MGPRLGVCTQVAAGREGTGRGRGSCFGGLFFIGKKSSKFRSTGTIFALGILKLQMFPNFMMVRFTTFWLDVGMKEISLR